MKRSMLEQIEDKHELLLLYMADELTLADRLSVERLLQTDAELREEFHLLASADAMMHQQAHADAIDQAMVDRCIEKAQSIIGQADAAPSTLAKEPPRKLPLPWWLYPMAAAASVLIAAAVFVANLTPQGLEPMATSPAGDFASLIETSVNFDVPVSRDAEALADDLSASFDDSEPVLAGAGSSQLLAAARELEALRESSQQFAYLR